MTTVAALYPKPDTSSTRTRVPVPSPSLGASELRLRLGSNLSFSCPSDALPRGTTLPRSAERRERERERDIRNESSRVRHRFYFIFFFFINIFLYFPLVFCVLNRSCLFVCISSYSFVLSFKSKCSNNLGFFFFFKYTCDLYKQNSKKKINCSCLYRFFRSVCRLSIAKLKRCVSKVCLIIGCSELLCYTTFIMHISSTKKYIVQTKQYYHPYMV